MPLHPQVAAFLDALAAQRAPGWDEMPLAESRQTFAGLTEWFGEPPAMDRVEDQAAAGRVPLRVYRPSSARPLPVVMYFHGGGWVLGDLDTHDSLCRRLAIDSGCAVVAVDYRRAPEHPFPAALDDCFDATAFVAANADALGIDPRRVAVAGDSAGGNLATSVALKAREAGGPVLHSQWLIYPAIDANCDTPSYQQFAEGFGLTRRVMEWFWTQYLADRNHRFDPLAVPLQAASLRGLPAAHILTAEYDVLRDDGHAYARRLRQDGVAVTTRCYEGMIHGFVHFAAVFDEGRAAAAQLAQAMRQALQP